MGSSQAAQGGGINSPGDSFSARPDQLTHSVLTGSDPPDIHGETEAGSQL